MVEFKQEALKDALSTGKEVIDRGDRPSAKKG